MRSHAVLACAVLGISACTAFGPDRKPPPMPPPAHYSVESQPGTDRRGRWDLAAGGAGARPVPQWWQEFGSDDLNALVEEGLKNSPSYASAQSTLKAAREQLRSQIGDNLLPQVDLTFSPARQTCAGYPDSAAADVHREHLRRAGPGDLHLRFLRRRLPGRPRAGGPGQATGVAARGNPACAGHQHRRCNHQLRLVAGAGRRNGRVGCAG